jgi:hypothetical protein
MPVSPGMLLTLVLVVVARWGLARPALDNV